MGKQVYGIVVFYDPDYTNKTIKEITRTNILPFNYAIDVYANTPNPASQIIQFSTEEEQIEAEKQLQANIVNKEWLEDLFNQI